MGRGIFEVEAGAEFRRVANALRDIDTALPGKFRRELRKALTPVVQDVRKAALSLPARTGKHTGLRQRLARGVAVRVSVGRRSSARIVTRMVEPDEAALPRGEDSGAHGWKHPVYGNESNIVRQVGGSWFRETIMEDKDFIERKLTDVLEEARDFVTGNG